ncbi:hypothetical protein DPMN_177223 [Dreissena polymorpha]|uniref:Uncharacterized protein n=1 Tax=Dreissena polymorpha TaxID=45954 RepID=A0A9D4E9V1_DREPO|nr:hypothetical protein DPMN_177223 [Dreissena polymorpha]
MSVSSFKVKGTGSSEDAMAVPRFAEGNLPRSSVKVMGPRGQEAQNVPGGIWDIKIGDMNVGSYWDCNSTVL